MDDGALVLFSGGRDSTACLGWALERFGVVETVGFQYGRRHGVEMSCRGPVLAMVGEVWGERLGVGLVLELAESFAGLEATALMLPGVGQGVGQGVWQGVGSAEIGVGAGGLLEGTVELARTCSRGDRSVRHAWGGDCPACRLRADGYARFRAAA